MKAVSQFYGRRQVEELKGPPRTFRIGKHLKDLWEKIPPGDLELRLFTSLYAQEKKATCENEVLLQNIRFRFVSWTNT